MQLRWIVLVMADVRICLQEKMHRCPAANLLYRSYRAEQTAVMGFLLFMEKVSPLLLLLLLLLLRLFLLSSFFPFLSNQCTIGCLLFCLSCALEAFDTSEEGQ